MGGDRLKLGAVEKYLTTEGNLRRPVPVRGRPGTTGDHTGLTERAFHQSLIGAVV